MLLLFRLWSYANGLSADAHCALNFRACILCVVWVVLPFVSGFVSRTCDPHHRLLAVFEGMSAPALFFEVATHFPL